MSVRRVPQRLNLANQALILPLDLKDLHGACHYLAGRDV